jgi:hypothetical protein
MNPAKSKSAWLALLTAGGLYAWQNRDKIQSWVKTQRDQFNNRSGSSLPATGATRRIEQGGYSSPETTHGMYDTEI